jgi:hypothetical protein
MLKIKNKIYKSPNKLILIETFLLFLTLDNFKSLFFVINDFLGKNWDYRSSEFAECRGCPVVSWPNRLPP